MSATKTVLTAQEFDNYPFEEDKRYELDEGELIEMTRPGYKHNRVMQHLLVELVMYFRKHPPGEALISENLYALSSNTRRSPDVAIILGDRREELKDPNVIPIIPDIARGSAKPGSSEDIRVSPTVRARSGRAAPVQISTSRESGSISLDRTSAVGTSSPNGA